MMSEFQWQVIGQCVCGADVWYCEDEGHVKCPECICNYDEFDFEPQKNVPGFRQMLPSADSVFVKGLKVA